MGNDTNNENTYRVEFNDTYLDKDGNLQVYKRAIYLDMPHARAFSDSKLADITMEKWIPNEVEGRDSADRS